MGSRHKDESIITSLGLAFERIICTHSRENRLFRRTTKQTHSLLNDTGFYKIVFGV